MLASAKFHVTEHVQTKLRRRNGRGERKRQSSVKDFITVYVLNYIFIIENHNQVVKIVEAALFHNVCLIPFGGKSSSSAQHDIGLAVIGYEISVGRCGVCRRD